VPTIQSSGERHGTERGGKEGGREGGREGKRRAFLVVDADDLAFHHLVHKTKGSGGVPSRTLEQKL
jgi:hypothetical protein